MIRIVHVYGLLVNYIEERLPSKGEGRKEKKGRSVGIGGRVVRMR